MYTLSINGIICYITAIINVAADGQDFQNLYNNITITVSWYKNKNDLGLKRDNTKKSCQKIITVV